MEALGRQGVETAIFGSLLHATVKSAPDDVTRLRNLLAVEGIVAQRIEKIIPSLEDVFVTLIEQS
jgi:ABC-2 type transport system ATP-binding protein